MEMELVVWNTNKQFNKVKHFQFLDLIELDINYVKKVGRNVQQLEAITNWQMFKMGSIINREKLDIIQDFIDDTAVVAVSNNRVGSILYYGVVF